MKSSLGFVANKNAKLNGVRIYYFTELRITKDEQQAMSEA
jgi:hypothetical protein